MNDEIDDRLERLTRATANVAPRAGFGARVMAAIDTQRVVPGFWVDLPRAAKRVVPFAAIAAAASVIWAIRTARELDDEVTISPTATQAVVNVFDTAEQE